MTPYPYYLFHTLARGKPLFQYHLVQRKQNNLPKTFNKLSKLISIPQEGNTDLNKLKHKNVWGYMFFCTNDNLTLVFESASIYVNIR